MSLLDWWRKKWTEWFPPKKWIGLGGPFNLRPEAQCASCTVLLDTVSVFWFFEDTSWHVCDTCYCTIPMNELARVLFERTRDLRLLKYFDHEIVIRPAR